jgi:hypothetical protein
MRDLRSIMSYSNTIYERLVLTFNEHARENISTEDEQIGGERIPLSDASLRFKIVGGLTINKDREGHCIDTIHDSLGQFVRKSHGTKSALNESPLQPIIGLSHVKFYTYKPFFFCFCCVLGGERFHKQAKCCR